MALSKRKQHCTKTDTRRIAGMDCFETLTGQLISIIWHPDGGAHPCMHCDVLEGFKRSVPAQLLL